MRLFGTDGIRGEYNTKLNIDLCFEIGKAAANTLLSHGENICIGMDPRKSSSVIETALVSGLVSGGMNVTKFGVVSTPVISFAVIKENYDFGIMISASHNPYTDNGIKFFGKNGQKLSEELEKKIEDTYYQKNYITKDTSDIHTIKTDLKIIQKYEEYLISLGTPLTGKKIALDCSNGSASNIAPELFIKLGAEIEVIGASPDGININKEIGSTHPQTMSKFIKNNKFDFGFSYDGDADRVIMYNQDGNILDGDYILYLLTMYFKRKNELNNNELITTIMVNLGLITKLKEHDIDVIQTQVGDKYVMEALKERSSTVGGEQSGHIIIPNLLPTGDGILVSVILSKIIVEEEINLVELMEDMKKFPQILMNKKVGNKHEAMNRQELLDEIKKAEEEMNGEGRILVRASGTEELVRVMVENKSLEKCEQYCKHLLNFVY